jgi:hypothetical protein
MRRLQAACQMVRRCIVTPGRFHRPGAGAHTRRRPGDRFCWRKVAGRWSSSKDRYFTASSCCRHSTA